PGQLADRPRTFLEPAVIGEAPVPEIRVRTKADFQRVRAALQMTAFQTARGGGERFADRGLVDRGFPGRQRGAGDESIVPDAAPALFEIGPGILFAPMIAQEFV